MSLYNLIHGFNPLAGALLSALNLTPDACGRFRDCFLARADDGKLEIHVYTRNGGGNRPDYIEVTQALRKHPEYIYDEDDDFDCTYATYKFSVPSKFAEALEKLAEHDGAVPSSPQERFQAFMDKLQSGPSDDPDVKRVTDAVSPLLSAIAGSVK